MRNTKETFGAYCTFWGENLIALDLDRVCNERCILRTTEKLVILMFEKSRARLCYVFVYLINCLNGQIKNVTILFQYILDTCTERNHARSHSGSGTWIRPRASNEVSLIHYTEKKNVLCRCSRLFPTCAWDPYLYVIFFY